MITARLIEYWNDYRNRERKERFMDLEHLADWIFDQMQVDYTKKENRFAMYFPECKTRDRICHISLTPEYGGPALWIKLIKEDGLGIIFSDGTFTAGQKYCTRQVKEWLAKCNERKRKPVFNFAPDTPEVDAVPVKEAVPADVVKMAAYKIHKAGGCDAKDDYNKGYDEAISLALDILLKETGLDFDEVMDYAESCAEGRTA